MRLPVSTSSGDGRRRPSMLGDVVGDAVLPATPDHPEPRASEDPDRVRVGVALRDRTLADPARPRRVMAGVVGEVDARCAELLVAGPPEAHDPALSRGTGDRSGAGEGHEALRVGEPLPRVADLGQQRAGPDPVAGSGPIRDHDATEADRFLADLTVL